MNDIILIAYLDGDLPPQDRHAVEKEIGESAEMAERAAILQASRLPYHGAFAHQKLPPVPKRLAKKVEQIARAALEAASTKGASPAANDTVLERSLNNQSDIRK